MNSSSENVYDHWNGFSRNPLNRDNEHRKDVAYLQNLLEAGSSKFSLFSKLKPLIQVGTNGEIAKAVWKSLSDIKLQTDEFDKLTTIYLGLWNDVAYFAVDVTSIKEDSPLFTGNTFTELRTIAPNMSWEDGAILGQARALLQWLNAHPHCAKCGSITRIAQGGNKRICQNTQCNTQHFPRTDPCVIMLVTNKDRTKILLGRKAMFPQGMFSCLAGFMEPGETVEESVRRETFEESGIRVGKISYHSSQPWPYPSQIMIAMTAEALTEEVVVDTTELEEARWFDREEVRKAVELAEELGKDMEKYWKSTELRVAMPYAVAHQLIKSWLENK